MKAVKNVLTSYNQLCYIYVKFKRTSQSCSPSKISQSNSVEWCTCDRNGKQSSQWKQKKLWSFDKVKNVLIEKKKRRKKSREIWAMKNIFVLDFAKYLSY